MRIELPSLSRQVRAGGPSTGLEGTITRGSIYSVVEFGDCFLRCTKSGPKFAPIIAQYKGRAADNGGEDQASNNHKRGFFS